MDDEINELLNGVAVPAKGYQDGIKHWNVYLEFDQTYERPLVARIVEDNDKYKLLMDTAISDDNRRRAKLRPGADLFLEREIELEMQDYSPDSDREKPEDVLTEDDIYREICSVIETVQPLYSQERFEEGDLDGNAKDMLEPSTETPAASD